MTGVEALTAMLANPGVLYTCNYYAGRANACHDGEDFRYVLISGDEQSLTIDNMLLKDASWRCAETAEYLHAALADRLEEHASNYYKAEVDKVHASSMSRTSKDSCIDFAKAFSKGIREAADYIRKEATL